MSTTTTAKLSEDGKARHGPRTEVTWEGGSGRQPYGNQSLQESGPPNGGDEFAQGDRGEHSGRNQEQLEKARGTPRPWQAIKKR